MIGPAARRGAAVALAALLAVPSSYAAAAACEPGAAPAVVVGVEQGDTLRLDRPVGGKGGGKGGEQVAGEGGGGGGAATTVRLAGIHVADGAGDALLQLLAGARVCVALAGARQDRYGRLLAQVNREDGLWLQGELLRLGLARVEPTPDARADAAAMLAIEREARTARAGQWRTEALRIRTPVQVATAAGSFQLVEGRVVDAARRQDRWYLNFGADWRTDFTVVIPKPAFAAFAEAGMDPYGLKDRIIRVRGWVDLQNGPMIEVLLPEQIEIVETANP